MSPLHFTRVRDRELSLWQSSIADYLRKELSKTNQPTGKRDVLNHPLSIATAAYASRKFNDINYEATPSVKGDTSHEALVFKSHLGHQIGEALANNNTELVKVLSEKYRKYCDDDYSIGPPPTGFATCPFTYQYFKNSTGGKMTYNDWTVAGNGNINYGVIQWKLPNNAKVGILGDWGTGMPDAIALLKDMMIQHKPDAIIHLGDIYYSGAPFECDQYFRDVFTNVFNEVLGPGKRIPVFSIPGNHDYYAWGAEYYNVVSNVNNYPGISNAVQPASYFCLRTEDGGWQFLAMDTGYNDSNPSNQLNTAYAGPWLQPNEVLWHQDKMRNFNGATILLSHHQLYSSNTKINGSYSPMNAIQYYNPFLYGALGEYIPTNVGAWIWGHEHNFVMYADNFSQLAIGRLVGNSAYEEERTSTPYKINYPQVPYLVPEPIYDQYKLGTNADANGTVYYNHGYAIIDLSGRANPTDPVAASYYQFPAWGDMPPTNPVSSFIYKESFALPQVFNVGSPVDSGYNYFLSGMDGMNMQPVYDGPTGWYPLLLPGFNYLSVQMLIQEVHDRGGAIQDNDFISISSTETILKNAGKTLLTATTAWVYYSNGGSDIVTWKVHKKNNNGDPVIRVGDAFYLESAIYPGYFLKPNYAIKWSAIYLTIDTGKDYWWRLNVME